MFVCCFFYTRFCFLSISTVKHTSCFAEKQADRDSVISSSKASSASYNHELLTPKKAAFTPSGHHFASALEALNLPSSGAATSKSPSSKASSIAPLLEIPEHAPYFTETDQKTSSNKVNAESQQPKVPVDSTDAHSLADSAVETDLKSSSQRLSLSLNDLTSAGDDPTESVRAKAKSAHANLSSLHDAHANLGSLHDTNAFASTTNAQEQKLTHPSPVVPTGSSAEPGRPTRRSSTQSRSVMSSIDLLSQG